MQVSTWTIAQGQMSMACALQSVPAVSCRRFWPAVVCVMAAQVAVAHAIPRGSRERFSLFSFFKTRKKLPGEGCVVFSRSNHGLDDLAIWPCVEDG